MNRNLTCDDFLGGQLKITQPKEGFRAGSDTVFLAASVKARKGAKILDVGAGVGTVSLCLAHRCPHVQIDAMELRQDMVDLALQNVESNRFRDKVKVFQGDIFNAKKEGKTNSYDVVMTNPPYFTEAITMHNPARLSGRIQQNFTIQNWIQACLKMLKPRGYIHMIYPVAQLDAVIAELQKRTGDILIFPLWPKGQTDCKRAVIVARKSVKSPTRLSQGIMLHDDQGTYTPQAQGILWDGKGLFD